MDTASHGFVFNSPSLSLREAARGRRPEGLRVTGRRPRSPAQPNPGQASPAQPSSAVVPIDFDQKTDTGPLPIWRFSANPVLRPFGARGAGGAVEGEDRNPLHYNGVSSPVRPDGSLSLREGVPLPGRRPHYLRHLREAGRPVCERQCQSGRTGRSVCERECRSWVARPNIYDTCARRVAQFARGSAGPARRVAQFARGSAGPGSPAPLFTALARGGSLSLREAAPVR